MLLNTACEHFLAGPGTPEAQTLGLSHRQLHASAASRLREAGVGSQPGQSVDVWTSLSDVLGFGMGGGLHHCITRASHALSPSALLLPAALRRETARHVQFTNCILYVHATTVSYKYACTDLGR